MFDKIYTLMWSIAIGMTIVFIIFKSIGILTFGLFWILSPLLFALSIRTLLWLLGAVLLIIEAYIEKKDLKEYIEKLEKE